MLVSHNLSIDEPFILQGETVYWSLLRLKEVLRVKVTDKEISGGIDYKSSFKLRFSTVLKWSNLFILRMCVYLEALLYVLWSSYFPS